MRRAWAQRTLAAAAAVFLCGAAQADQLTGKSKSGETTVGVGVICNTSEQAARYIGLVGGGREPKPALETVNREAKDPRACGLATVAFVRDQTMETKTVRNTLVEIVRINVVAGFDGSGWHRVAGMVQYAVIEGEGVTI